MSVRHVQALVLGFTGSGKTTLITRWIKGHLTTTDTQLLPFNGVKGINMTARKGRIQELVMLRLIDGEGLSDADIRRLSGVVDVIVVCMCVELNGLDVTYIQDINEMLTSRRPPVVIVGTMSDLRDHIYIIGADCSSDDDEDRKSDTRNNDRLPEKTERNLTHTGKLTVENITRHRVSFSVHRQYNHDATNECDTTSDMTEKCMVSLTESDGITDLDMSSISDDIQRSMQMKKNPELWSTESINGSLANLLDHSLDSCSEGKQQEDREVTLSGRDNQHESHANRNIEQKSPESEHYNKSCIKPFIETHFPVNLETPLTVKHFPKVSDEPRQPSCPSQLYFPSRESNWSTEDDPNEMTFSDIAETANTPLEVGLPFETNTNAGPVPAKMSTLQRYDQQLLSATMTPPSCLPEDRNFHGNLDPEPMTLSDLHADEFNARVNINGYCKQWTRSDGLRLARSLRADTYLECSAYTGDNLQHVFQHVARVGWNYNRKKNNKCVLS